MFLQFVWLGHPLHGSTATRGGLGIFVQILGLEGGGSLLRSRVMTRLPSDRRTDARWLNGLGTAWNSFSPTATRAGHALLPWRGAVLALDWDSRGRAPYSYSVVAWFGGWRCKFSSVAGLTRCWKTPFWEVVCANDTQKDSGGGPVGHAARALSRPSRPCLHTQYHCVCSIVRACDLGASPVFSPTFPATVCPKLATGPPFQFRSRRAILPEHTRQQR